MFKRALPLLIVTGAAILSGCSGLPSQQLDLHPQVSTSRQLPADTQMLVEAFDNRASKVLGYRVDRLKNRAPIELTNAEKTLRHAAEDALRNMGITHFGAGEFDMTIIFDELTYQAAVNDLVQKVDLGVKFRIKVEKHEQSYTGSYASTREHKFVRTPTPEDNQEIIEQLLSETMERAFNDTKLLDFIQFN